MILIILGIGFERGSLNIRVFFNGLNPFLRENFLGKFFYNEFSSCKLVLYI